VLGVRPAADLRELLLHQGRQDPLQAGLHQVRLLITLHYKKYEFITTVDDKYILETSREIQYLLIFWRLALLGCTEPSF
jgi:hypothetical protein